MVMEVPYSVGIIKAKRFLNIINKTADSGLEASREKL